MHALRTKLNTLALILVACFSAVAQTSMPRTNYAAPIEGDFVVKNFKFKSGESLPELKLHYAQ
jgi:homoserine O-acetyltransferase/O-succinyltransferase